MRWIAGGTGAGKSTLARILADQYDVAVYDGDRAEHGWLARCTPQRHPRLAAMRGAPPGEMWRGRTSRQLFQTMASLHGETVGFIADDLLAMPSDRVIVVDYFGILPGHLGPLLRQRDQAVFLLPTPRFRREALAARYADPVRARANWGSNDLESTLAKRLGRDALWDEEVRRQADDHGLDVVTIDGGAPVADLAGQVAARFALVPRA
ncbi:ATP-binding protein [Actinomadura harenae]|uniref:Dephospho-CoA kinase n=1 Tax=Actinomadura harenae TaxID=2483351 RepID=A0A3M2M1X0_9ACTN|nr:hypothetical protein [Actinomadura harenae]RMI43060.1 hypothetical protein EBO15_17655 [Actinomadura harenae]